MNMPGRRCVKPIAQLIDGKYDVDSYIAGIMHGMPDEDAKKLIAGRYGHMENWRKDDLDDLLTDVDDARDERSFVMLCRGMLYDFPEKERDALMEKVGTGGWLNVDYGKIAALWREAQRLRKELRPKALKAKKTEKNTYSTDRDAFIGMGANFTPNEEADVDVCLNDIIGCLKTALTIFGSASEDLSHEQWAAVTQVDIAHRLAYAVFSKLAAFDNREPDSPVEAAS